MINNEDILQRLNYDINKRFDERDRAFDRLEKLLYGLYALFILVLLTPWLIGVSIFL